MNIAKEKTPPNPTLTAKPDVRWALNLEIQRIHALAGPAPENGTFSDTLWLLRQKQSHFGDLPLAQLKGTDHATLLALTAGIKSLANPDLGSWDDIMEQANHLVNGHLPNLAIRAARISEAETYLVELDQRRMNINAKDGHLRADAKKAMEEAKNLSALTGMFKLNEQQRPKATQKSKSQMEVISKVISTFGIKEPFF